MLLDLRSVWVMLRKKRLVMIILSLSVSLVVVTLMVNGLSLLLLMLLSGLYILLLVSGVSVGMLYVAVYLMGVMMILWGVLPIMLFFLKAWGLSGMVVMIIM